MKIRRSTALLVAAASITAAALVSTVPAQAAGSIFPDGNGGIITSGLSPTGDIVLLCDSSVVLLDGDCGRTTNETFVINTNGTFVAGSTVLLPTTGTTPLVAGTYHVAVWNQMNRTVPGNFSSRTTLTIAPSGGGGGGGGGGSIVTPTANEVQEPVTVSLSLDLAASGAACKEGTSAAGVFGSWLTLPGAGDCSSIATPGAKLLGWSTNAGFPVAMAQSQVDKGWGAIDDTFNGVRMIFIPAGQATFVSGPNTLHPIWAR